MCDWVCGSVCNWVRCIFLRKPLPYCFLTFHISFKACCLVCRRKASQVVPFLFVRIHDSIIAKSVPKRGQDEVFQTVSRLVRELWDSLRISSFGSASLTTKKSKSVMSMIR